MTSPTRRYKTAGNRPELLGHAPRGNPGTAFKDPPDNWSMLDPIKVSILALRGDDGELKHPAYLLRWSLRYGCRRTVSPTHHRLSVDYVPVLMGSSLRKWGTLIVPCSFKHH